jgi:peptidoglycan glycosyltransferase
MQAQIRRVGIGLLIGFLLVFAQLNYVQIFAAQSIAGNDANIRSLLAEYAIKRGEIETVDFEQLATSKATGGKLKYQRIYPGGSLYGHITGWYSLVFGTDRIERTYNEQLLGESGVISMQDIEDTFLGSGERGDDVRLTVHSRLQQIAASSLGDQLGSVVALDPQTGAVRALYSNPSFDPGPLASHDPPTIREYWRSLNPRSPTSPLVNKATSRSFPPGSTFKVVTAAAALESGRYSPGSTFPDPEAIPLPQTDETLTNFTNTSCTGTGSIDLFTALEVSCDTTFGLIGLQVPDQLHDTAQALGFNGDIPFDVATEASSFPRVPDDQQPFRAFAGIGQGDVAATPLQMALVAATIANGGEVPRPRLLEEIRDPSGSVVERPSPETLGQAMSPETAAELSRMMTAVVESGTGTAAQIPDIPVAGKTGTAQSREGASPHAWFICFAPAGNPRIAVAVLVENGGSLGSEATGGAVAAPIAKAIIEEDQRIRGW